MNTNLFVSITQIILFIFLCPIAQAQWTNPIIDTLTKTQTTKYTALQSLALDTLGHAHIAWRSASHNPTDFRIWYATNSPNNNWSAPIVVSDTSANSPALALSPTSQQPFITFEQGEADSSEIYLAYKEGEVWKKERLTNNQNFDRFSTIAIDDSGRIHIAWIIQEAYGSFKLAYAYGEIGKWKGQVLESSVNPLLAYLAVTSDGKAHIVYRGDYAPDFHIHHAWNDTTGGQQWSFEMLATGNNADLTSSLAIDQNENLHLAIGGYNDFDSGPRKVYYLFKSAGGAWQPVEFVAERAYVPSIDVTNEGKPHILWTEMDEFLPVLATGRLFHSQKNTNGDWQSILALEDDYFYPSFKIDKQGFGHIATSTGGNSYSYDIYHVRSRDVVTSIKQPIEIEAPNTFELLQNYPNPFNPSTKIVFCLSSLEKSDLEIYDIAGRLIRSYSLSGYQTGENSIDWDGKDNQGKFVSSGNYFYVLKTANQSSVRKMILLR